MMTLVMILFVHTAIKFSHMNVSSSSTCEDKRDGNMHLSLYSKCYSVYILESTPTTLTTESQSPASTPTSPTENTISTVTTTETSASTGNFLYFVVIVRHFYCFICAVRKTSLNCNK